MTAEEETAAAAVRRLPRTLWRAGEFRDGERTVPEETAVAFTYDGSTHAVMLATPGDLTDFAIGFTITEGIVSSPDEIMSLDVVDGSSGIELRMWLSAPRRAALSTRRRRLAGPTGCGLCGVESLDEACRPPPRVAAAAAFSPQDIMTAVGAIAAAQRLNRETRAMHGAAFWQPSRGIVAMREDVGRHNALDKLGGALARGGIAPGSGVVVVTSRVSVEMVQKAAFIGVPVMVAVSAPTALAVRTAERAGITLVAVARGDGFEIFTHPLRITRERPAAPAGDRSEKNVA